MTILMLYKTVIKDKLYLHITFLFLPLINTCDIHASVIYKRR